MSVVKSVRNGLTIMAAIAVLGLGSTAAGTVVERAQAAPANGGGTCQNFELHMTPLRSDGGMGHVAEMFRIHNVTGTPCALAGYPGAMLLDGAFASLPTRVNRGLGYLVGKRRVVTVRLQGNHDAYFVAEWTHIPSTGQQCPTARYIMITAPNDRLPVVTYAGGAGIDACGGNLTVSPVASTRFGF